MSLESWYPEELPRRPIERDGIRLETPRGWEARIRRAEVGERGGQAHPVLHAATVPLAGDRADFGGGVVERLQASDLFIALVEYGPEEAGTALYPEVDELPTLAVEMFHRNQLQRRIRGQAGLQRFFTYRGRPFCLYVVLGSIGNAHELVREANELLRNLTVGAT